MSRMFNGLWRMLGLVLVMLALLPPAAFGGHTDPLPLSIEAAVCGFVADMDELVGEFDLQVGEFEDDRLNRALDKARHDVVQTQESATMSDLVAAFRHLQAAMRELEKGAAVPVSGTGFADDIASLGSFFAEVFVGELITLVDDLGLLSAETLATATGYYLDGAGERDDAEWEAALMKFTRAIRTLDGELAIDSPCTTAL